MSPDPASLMLGFFGGLIADSLRDAIGSYLAESLLPEARARLRAAIHTKHVCTPEELGPRLANGNIKPGEYVEGTAFMSMYTATNLPRFPLQYDMNHVMDSMIEAMHAGGGVPNPVVTVLPTTQFPVRHSEYRVAFLYPHRLQGFGIPFMSDGTVEALPFLARHVCIVPLGIADNLANRIVSYRCRVLQIPKDDIDEHFGPISDDAYESMRKAGKLTFLSAVESQTSIQDFEAPPSPFLIGSHFLETHWEQPEVLSSNDFGAALNSAVHAALAAHNLPAPRASTRGGQGLPPMNCWALPGFTVMQPQGLPYFHLQLQSNLMGGPTAEHDRNMFEGISSMIVDGIEHHFGLSGPRDLDAVSNYNRDSHNTILQSSAARTITDPILSGVRSWLEREKAHGSRPTGN